MSAPQQSTIRNQLLAGMPRDDFTALQPHLEPVPLELRQRLFEPSEPIEHVYFPEVGIASVATNGSRSGGGRDSVEVGIIGREGLIGVPIVLAVDRSPFECFIQTRGHGLRIAAAALDQALHERPGLHRYLLRYVQALTVQTCATAFVNAEHTLEMRLARWLLMCHDRVDGDELQLTHEFISVMLGVRRAGVTTGLHILEGSGLIRSTRGLITVRDRERLEALADNAYGLPEAEYARLMGYSQ